VRRGQVGTLKAKLQDECGVGAASLQKLIFMGARRRRLPRARACRVGTEHGPLAGRVLTDETTLADAKVTENDFLVVMVSKVRHRRVVPARSVPA
jgi:hypothetical protein